jgi:glycosyltransferase involved in cell wall biosynthesis
VSPASIPVSVIVLTYNEAVNIVSCLETLSAFDEILVVDSGSTDGTLDILRNRFPGIRVLHHAFQDFGQQRNWALDHGDVRNEWILFFDADERCTVECASAVLAAIAQPGGHVGFFLCYRNMFLGRWIKRCTLYPTWQLRLLKVGQVRYRREGHGQREVMKGSAGYIPEPYDHYGFSKGIKNWISKHNDYSSNEVELIRSLASASLRVSELFSRDPVLCRRALKRLAARAPLRPVARFVHLYFLRRGFLDGRPGFLYCLLVTAHQLHLVVKLAEANQVWQPTESRAEAAGWRPLPTDHGASQALCAHLDATNPASRPDA